MKKVLTFLPVLLILSAAGVFAQPNIFNPSDPIVTYNRNSPPATPAANTMAKWVTTQRISDWTTTAYKSYYWNGMAFRLRFPKNYSVTNATKYPVVVFFHGAGEIAPVYDNDYQLVHGAKQFQDSITADKWNGFLLFPQVSTTSGWDDSYFSRINSVLDSMKKYCNTDENRIIPIGLSNGGYGSIFYSTYYPERTATVVSSSPALVFLLAGATYQQKIVHIPYWVANGGRDLNPNPREVKTFIDSLRARGGDIRQNYYPQNGHDTWYSQWNEGFLMSYWNNAHKANPLVFFNRRTFQTEAEVNAKMGVTAGFAQYEWQKNGLTIAGATANEYTATSYGTYRVRFKRTVTSEWSAYSPIPVVIFKDVTAPSTPASLTSPYKGKNFVYLDWAPSSDNVGVTSYDIYVNGVKKYNSREHAFTADGLDVNTTYSFVIRALDSAGNASGASTSLSAATVSPSNGLKYRYFQPDIDSVPNYNNLTPVKVGTSTNFDLSVRTAGVDDWFGFVWEGNINIPVAGNYTFELVTDDGGKFYFDSFYKPNAQALLFNPNAGTNSATFATTAGQHAIALSYVEIGGSNNVQLYWTGPNFTRQLVPASAFNEPSADVTVPTTPTALKIGYTGRTFADLSWTASTDNVGVTGYDIYVNNVKTYTSLTTSFTADNLTPNQSYSFTVRAVDAAANNSAASTAVTTTTSASGFRYSFYYGIWDVLPNFNTLTPGKTGTSANVDISVRPTGENWNYGFKWEGYIKVPSAGTYTFETRSDDGSKFYFNSFYSPTAVALVDNDGSHSASSPVSGTITVAAAGVYPIAVTYFQKGDGQTMELYWSGPGIARQLIPASAFTEAYVLPADLVAPTAPSQLKIKTTNATSVDLSWNKSTDNIAVTGYKLYKNNVLVDSTSGDTTISALALTPNTSYAFTVKAFDAAGNLSAASNSVTATTSANGLNYKFYEGIWNVLPNFNTLTPRITSTSSNVDISVRPAGLNWNYAFLWDGYIYIPTAGQYTFELKSDDGSKFYFNSQYSPSITATVNNDGSHSASATVAGTVTVNTPGYYPIAATYFQKGDGQSMELYWTGPGIARQLVPNTAFTKTIPPSTDVTAPTVPANLQVVTTTPTTVSLDWDNSTDAVGVTGYDVYVNGTKTYTTTVSNIIADNLTANTSYSFTIKALDGANNASSFSAAVSATTPAPSTTGLNYKMYEGVWDVIPNFNTMTPVKTGVSATADISVRPAGLDWNYGFVWEGYIYIPTAGGYTFETKSDDGSKLYFNTLYNPAAVATVNNDGSHSASTPVSGNVTVNAIGWYPISITYFQKGDGQSIEVYYTGPGLTRRLIPASAFSLIPNPAAQANATSRIGSASTTSEAAASVIAQQALAMKAYPNPFIQSINLNFNNTSAANKVTVGIYDLNGKMVFRKYFENLTAGNNTLGVTVNNQKLHAGVYIVRLDVNGLPVNQWKMVKSKQ